MLKRKEKTWLGNNHVLDIVSVFNHENLSFSVSELDAPERIVENPTYGENDAPRQNTYEGVEQYSRTGPDYEPIERDLNAEEHYTSLAEATVPHIEYTSDID